MAGSDATAESSDERGTRHGHPVVPYIKLVRLPNLFTAPPDVVLGAALAVGGGATVNLTALAGLAVSSVLLYAAGTTLNDYVDAAEDAEARPERPIPSGGVSRSAALTLGSVLLAGGVTVAYVTVGFISGIVATALALVIVLYDGVFKGGLFGFLLMGSARTMNVILGTTAGAPPLSLPHRQLAVPVVILLYTGAVTYMADHETGDSSHTVVAVAIGGVALAGVAAVGFVLTGSPDIQSLAVALVLLAGFVVWTGRSLWTAYVDPKPATVGRAVGACVLGLVALDGVFAAITAPVWGVGAALFFMPAVGLARILDVT